MFNRNQPSASHEHSNSKLTKLVAIGAIGSAALTGCGGGGEKGPVSNTSSVAISETTKSPENNLNPDTVLQSDLYKSLNPNQKAAIDRIHKLSLSDFQSLSTEDKMAYGRFVQDVYGKYAENQIRTQGDISSNELRLPSKPMSRDSSGQDILLDFNLARSTAMWTMSEPEAPYAFRSSNYLDAQKMLSLLYSKQGPEYQNDLNMLASATISLQDSGSDAYYIDTAMEESVVDGNAIKRMNVLYNARTTQHVMQWVTFTDISGKTRGQWQMIENLSPGSAGWVTLPGETPQ